MKLLFVFLLAFGTVASADPFALQIHDILKGFFTGLHRNGSELVDKLEDPTKYLHRETVEKFVAALGDVANKKDVPSFVNLFTQSGVLLTEMQKVFSVVGDYKDSQKLGDFAKMISNGNVKTFIFTLLTDPLFHQDIQEMIAVFGSCSEGKTSWDKFGLKLGELFWTIFKHVPASLYTGAHLMADENFALQLHDILRGFFTGLHRNGSELVDKIDDPTKYLHRETIEKFIIALGDLTTKHDVPSFVNMFTQAGVMLTEVQKVFEIVGDYKDSQKLQEFAKMLSSGDVKAFIFGMLTDARFHQDIQEMIATFGACTQGTAKWDKFGMKLGELIYTMLSHVPKSLYQATLMADDDHWTLQIHDILRGFFIGLHKEGDNVDKVKDLANYIQRETLFEFVTAIQSIGQNPKDITRYVNTFTKASILLTQLQKVVEAAGDIADAQKFSEFALMMKTGNMKDFFFGILTDFHFHQDAQQMIAVFKSCQAGEAEWARFGTKLGELFHTILSHVPKPKV